MWLNEKFYVSIDEGDKMEDNEIIELYWKRDEVAILETDKKYGKYCSKRAMSCI